VPITESPDAIAWRRPVALYASKSSAASQTLLRQTHHLGFPLGSHAHSFFTSFNAKDWVLPLGFRFARQIILVVADVGNHFDLKMDAF
jgi:hypothetical protein